MGGTDLLLCLEAHAPCGPGRFLKRAGFRTGDTSPRDLVAPGTISTSGIVEGKSGPKGIPSVERCLACEADGEHRAISLATTLQSAALYVFRRATSSLSHGPLPRLTSSMEMR